MSLTIGTMMLCATAHAFADSAVSREAERKQLSLTVYNQDLALVREVRQLEQLGNGRTSLEFRDVASTIQPETVVIRPLAGATLRVLEQNYRFELLSPQTLLEKHVGRNVRAYRYHEATGKEDAVDAKLLSVNEGQVLQIGNEITFNYPGRLAFSELPPSLIAKPTLIWLLESQTPKPTVEVTYLAKSLSWRADYVLLVDEMERKADLTGWVTLMNDSGASYPNAELKLVAGDVHRVAEEGDPNAPTKDVYAGSDSAAFHEEELFEYHLYSLKRPTDLLDKEQKQVTLLEAPGIGVTKEYVLASRPDWSSKQSHSVKNQKVTVLLEFRNNTQNHLGMPLPKGIVHIYKAGKDGQKEFLGEDSIDHTPRDEKLDLRVGAAFDLVADRTQTEWHALRDSDCSWESTWQIELRNHKSENVVVEVVESSEDAFTVLQSSQPARKTDARTVVFDVAVPKRGTATLTYRVRARRC